MADKITTSNILNHVLIGGATAVGTFLVTKWLQSRYEVKTEMI